VASLGFFHLFLPPIKIAIPYPHFIAIEKAAKDADLLFPSSPSAIFAQDNIKKIVAYEAIEYVESNMIIDLGLSESPFLTSTLSSIWPSKLPMILSLHIYPINLKHL